MKKPLSLRDALVAALDGAHHIKGDTTRLQMVMTNVRTLTSGRPGGGFQYAYTLEIHMPGFNGDPTEITVPLLVWIERYQNQLLTIQAAEDRGLDMTFVLLDDSRYDVHIALELTENIRFEPRPAGGHDVVFLPEPLPMALEQGRPLHAVYLHDQLILHCEAHPDLGV